MNVWLIWTTMNIVILFWNKKLNDLHTSCMKWITVRDEKDRVEFENQHDTSNSWKNWNQQHWNSSIILIQKMKIQNDFCDILINLN